MTDTYIPIRKLIKKDPPKWPIVVLFVAVILMGTYMVVDNSDRIISMQN